MKALTVRHPWAWAIIEGGKDVENRSRKTNYRGPLYIHAAQAMDFDAFMDKALVNAEVAYFASQGSGPFGEIAPIDLSTCGMVLGTVDLIDCHPSTECFHFGEPACSPWAFREPDLYHWVLANPRPLEIPFDAKGKLGIWNLDAA
jgi:hypothetical protein